MKTIRNVADRIVFAYIRRRLAHFQKCGDVYDQFADSIAALLTAEIGRRNVMLTGWDADLRRAAAMQDFKSLEHQEGLRLQ